VTDPTPTRPSDGQRTSDDDLVTVVTCATEFEAATKVAVLQDAGIESFAFGAAHAALPLQARFLQVPVQVRAADLERAQAILDDNRRDAPSIDWDRVDVGERDDALPLRASGHMPWPAKIGFALAMLVLAVMVASVAWSAIAAIATRWR
jgi:hypothetical protein